MCGMEVISFYDAVLSQRRIYKEQELDSYFYSYAFLAGCELSRDSQ